MTALSVLKLWSRVLMALPQQVRNGDTAAACISDPGDKEFLVESRKIHRVSAKQCGEG